MQTLLFFSLLSFVTVKGIQMKAFGVEGVPSLIRSDRPSIPNPYISNALGIFLPYTNGVHFDICGLFQIN